MTHMISVRQLTSLLVCTVFFLISLNIILNHIDVGDRPDPLRFTEILIVIFVLMLWCASIFKFIRRSRLLRIRHRDVPYDSTIQYQSLPSPTNLNHVSVITRSSEISVHPKSRVSSMDGLTPPMSRNLFQTHRRPDGMETISLVILPEAKKRRHTHSYDLDVSSVSTYPLDKRHDTEYLLHPNRNVSGMKSNVLELQPKSCDNLPRKSVDNLSTVKYSIFHSSNDTSRRKSNDTQDVFDTKRCIHESPV